MDLSAALAADLAALSDLLDEPDVDLEAGLRALGVSLRTAIGAYRAMTMTVDVDGHRVSLTVFDGADQIDGAHGVNGTSATTLLIPLSRPVADRVGNSLVLHARTPGAFVDLAADLSYALGIDASELVLDAHLGELATPVPATGMTGTADLAVVNQALGVLLARGHTPEGARTELRRLAEQGTGSVSDAAAAIVGELRQRH